MIATFEELADDRHAEDLAAQRHTQCELRKQVEHLNLVIENVAHGCCLFDANQCLIMCNERYLQIYGFDRKMIKAGMTFRSILKQAIQAGLYPDVALDELYDKRSPMFRQEPTSEQIRLSNGRVIETTVRPVGTEGWLAEHQDVTVRVRYEETLRERNRLLDATLEHMAHGLCAFDEDLRVVVVNHRYLDMYGLTEKDAQPGTSQLELMRHSIARGVHLPGVTAEEMFADFRQRLVEKKEPVLQRRLANGRVVAVRHQPMAGGGWVGTYEDITEQRMARHDVLTDLPNRLLFQEKMAAGLVRVRDHNESMAVLCLDLDNMKYVNDSLGHPTGDKLLQCVAKRLCAAIRQSDTIARLGGDEFAILRPLSTSADVEALARRLIQIVSGPAVIDGQEINTGISIGIAMAPDHGNISDDLMKCADLALYRAKAEGRNTFRFFDSEMILQIRARRAMSTPIARVPSSSSTPWYQHRAQ
jgi:diguanylate cyclase (GGDEF)-like protein